MEVEADTIRSFPPIARRRAAQLLEAYSSRESLACAKSLPPIVIVLPYSEDCLKDFQHPLQYIWKRPRLGLLRRKSVAEGV